MKADLKAIGLGRNSVLKHFNQLGECARCHLRLSKFQVHCRLVGRLAQSVTENEIIRRTLRETNGIIGGPNGAAARLGIKRSTLYFRMQKLGISRSRKESLPA